MFKILTLICLGTDPSACTEATAKSVIPGPEASLQQCMFLGQATLAPTPLAPELGERLVKVVCKSVHDTAAR